MTSSALAPGPPRRQSLGPTAIGVRLSAELLLLALFVGAAHAQVVQPKFWGTDGTVRSIARTRDVVYLAGNFSLVGPNSGGGVPLDIGEGAPLPGFPRVAGVVRAAVPDGEGGWFIGGDFSAVEGRPRVNLAHILWNGSVADWNPQAGPLASLVLLPANPLPVGTVATLALQGRTLFAGGAFTRMNGQARSHLAALDASSGRLLPFDPGANDVVTALAVRAHLLYVGGAFSVVGGQARACIAALDCATGTVTAWNPSADGSVRTIDFQGRTAYVGGEFDHIGGQPRNSIAALDLVTGAATAWDAQLRPLRQYLPHGDRIWPFVSSLVVQGRSLYATGNFDAARGVAREMVAQLDLATGAPTRFDAHAAGGYGKSLVLEGRTLYLGGWFATFGSETRLNLAALDAETGAVTAWNPRANAQVYALAPGREAIFAGGLFTSLRDWRSRQGLAALDAATGALLPWNPTTDAPYGFSDLRAIGDTVYVAGDFTQIDGQPRGHLASFDGTTGGLTAWNPWAVQVAPANDWTFERYPIDRMTSIGHTLYVAGMFDEVNGVPRRSLAAIDAVTGEVLDWNPNATGRQVRINALQPLDDTVYVAGDFSSIGGASRQLVAAIDGIAGKATAFDIGPSLSRYIADLFAIAPSRGAVYVGGWFLDIAGQSRLSLAAFGESGALLPADAGMNTSDVNGWVVGWWPTTHALAVRGDTLFVAGRFDSLGGRGLPNFAALDAATLVPFDWNPDAIAVPGYSERDGATALTLYGDTLYVGGDFTRLGGYPCAGFAAVTLAHAAQPGRALPDAAGPAGAPLFALDAPAPNPARSRTLLRFTLPFRAAVTLEVFDVQGRLVAMPLAAARRQAGPSSVALETRGWKAGVYFCRLEAAGRTAVRRLLVVR